MSYPRQREIESAVRGALKGGGKLARIECGADGKIALIFKDESAESPQGDADDILRQWQQRHAPGPA